MNEYEKNNLVSKFSRFLLYRFLMCCFKRVYTTTGTRKFNINIEGTTFTEVDIASIVGGVQRAVVLTAYPRVDDGALTITVTAIGFDQPCMSGIEIKESVPHIAHAVANGPYSAVDSTNIGSALVNVDASESHTMVLDWIYLLGRGGRVPKISVLVISPRLLCP
jgi:hypothetical protein